jgi:hypothetical protein
MEHEKLRGSEPLPPKSEVRGEVGYSGQKEWCQPVLRKLPIAATAQGKATGNSNDSGHGGGKGEVTGELS